MKFPPILLDCRLREETTMLIIIRCHKAFLEIQMLMTAVVSWGFLFCLLPHIQMANDLRRWQNIYPQKLS